MERTDSEIFDIASFTIFDWVSLGGFALSALIFVVGLIAYLIHRRADNEGGYNLAIGLMLASGFGAFGFYLFGLIAGTFVPREGENGTPAGPVVAGVIIAALVAAYFLALYAPHRRSLDGDSEVLKRLWSPR